MPPTSTVQKTSTFCKKYTNENVWIKRWLFWDSGSVPLQRRFPPVESTTLTRYLKALSVSKYLRYFETIPKDKESSPELGKNVISNWFSSLSSQTSGKVIFWVASLKCSIVQVKPENLSTWELWKWVELGEILIVSAMVVIRWTESRFVTKWKLERALRAKLASELSPREAYAEECSLRLPT